MGYEVRLLGTDDLPQAEPRPSTWERPGRHNWGVFDDAGRLVGKAVDREQAHWFGGRLVPASGIAGVVVVPEERGRGLVGLLLRRLLETARERGAVISTLFRTGPGPYRRVGCEEVGAMTWTQVPAAALAARAPDGIALRPAQADDVPHVFEAYRSVARSGNGLMERSGPLFDLSTESVLSAFDGITVAVGANGTIEGYASWDRDGGYQADGVVRVSDLVGLTAPATTALLAMLGTWGRVAPTIALRLAEPDPATLLGSFAGTRVESRDPWMLRVLDAAGAVAARGWPRHVAGSVDLWLDDDVCPWNAGPHRLSLEGGTGRLDPGGDGSVRLTARGLAVLYAGAGGAALLRRAGLLAGGDDDSDAFLEAATAGPAPALLDYF